jgi:photosystem II stability/assembly factor-like uncharacterized protein
MDTALARTDLAGPQRHGDPRGYGRPFHVESGKERLPQGDRIWLSRRILLLVMPVLVTGIHAFSRHAKAWMAGTSPAMTMCERPDWPYAIALEAPQTDMQRVFNPKHRIGLRRLAALVGALALLVGPTPVQAHDASAYGGVFRSRNAGGTWLNVDAGLFLSSALTVAVDPRNPAHLLLGTGTSLLRSLNGGRNWTPEARNNISGAVFAAAFAPDSPVMLCAASSGVFRFGEGRWKRARVPAGAVPARTIAFGAKSGRVYLLGQSGLFASDDQGRSFAQLHGPFENGAKVKALAVSSAPEETLFVLADGALLASVDGGSHWEKRGAEAGPLETLLFDQAPPGQLWTTVRGVLSTSVDLGRHWQVLGRLPDPNIVVRGIAADAARVIVTSDRGMYSSLDGGQTWRLEESGLPIHLEAGPLIRDPSDRRTLYAVYSLMPYSALWRAALEDSNPLSGVDATQLIVGSVLMLGLPLAGCVLIRRLSGNSRSAPDRPVSAEDAWRRRVTGRSAWARGRRGWRNTKTP